MHQLVSTRDDKDRYSQALYEAKMTQAINQNACACGVPFIRRGNMSPVEGLDLHHVVYRESRAKVLEAKLQLLDPRNCRLAHHECHMKEDWSFQVANMVMLLREFGTDELLAYYKTLGIPDRTLPSHAVYTINLWSDKYKRLMPAEEVRSKLEWIRQDDGSFIAQWVYGGEWYDSAKAEQYRKLDLGSD